MAEGVFQVLGGLVGHLGKGPESGHIDEGAAVELSDVAGTGDPLPGGDGGGLAGDAGQPQIGGAVVGGAEGDIAQNGGLLQLHQTGHRLAEGAVSSGAHHPVEPGAQLPSGPGGIPFPLGGIGGDQPVGLCKLIQHGGQLVGQLPLAGGGVIDEQKGFHGNCLLWR